MSNTLLVIYYSQKGATKKMATEIARGARDAGVNVVSKNVVDCAIDDLLIHLLYGQTTPLLRQ
jgi:flavodoxin